MPELPDIVVYQESLDRLLTGRTLQQVVIRSPFVLRTFDPTPDDCAGRDVRAVRRSGKRILWELDGDLHLVFHLMITGRFHWRKPGTLPTRKTDLAAFLFPHGSMLLTEAGSRKRASLHIHSEAADLQQHDRNGLDVRECTRDKFAERLTSVNRTLKRCLTDPNLFDGIGNAYSDEILHAACLSPLQLTRNLSSAEITRLHSASAETLRAWIARLRKQTGTGFPEKVTAFHPDMAVHGRYGQECPVCSRKVQRIVFAEREFNYCPGCQTGGRLLKDRSLSRLLRDDWPTEG